MLNLFVFCLFVSCKTYLSKEGHSEVRAQQPFASMHHLHHFSVRTVEGVVQVCQFLLESHHKDRKKYINSSKTEKVSLTLKNQL